MENNTPNPIAAPTASTEVKRTFPPRNDRSFGSRNSSGGSGGKGGDRKPRREPRAKPEFDQKIIDIRRVTRVSSGGRRFSFAVSIVAGNRKGSVGVGTGKASDTSLAIEKAFKNARKNMLKVNLTKDASISHEVEAKFCSSRVMIMPAKGKGIIAGSSVRDVLELAGIKDVVAKLRSGSKNKLNNARVAIDALSSLKPAKI
jgi:small subunit ribosomal protein S5